MLRSFITALLPVALLVLSPTPVSAQWERPRARAWMHPDIAGRYVVGNRGYGYVYRQDGEYRFVNENGSEAVFGWSGPRQLRVLYTINGWDPTVVVTVSRDRDGQTVLRFDTPGSPTGYWTRVY
jgi:hypothetical protein